jgi:hypothetical protein
MKLSALPRNLEQLIGSPRGKPYPGYDIVILYDPVPVGGYDERFAALLKRFVQEHGGGLCYIAGRWYTEASLLGSDRFNDVADLLPVELAPATSDSIERIHHRQPQAYHVVPTPYGASHPIMRLAPAASAAALWRALPGIFWSHPVQRIKPLAQILAVNANPYRRLGRDPDLREPVLVIQSSGAGRSLYVGFDGTWRWRYVRDAFYFRAFWRDVVRFLAPMKIRQVAILTPKTRYDLGERIRVEAEAYDEKFQPLTAELFKVLLINADDPAGPARSVELEAVDTRNKPGLYRGVIERLEEGTYRLLPAVPMPEERVDAVRIKVVRRQAEARRPEADMSTLAHPLGVASGEDHFARLDEMDKLSKLIPPGRLTFVHHRTREFLDSAPLAGAILGLFVVLLGAEWVIRKRYNMT